MALWSNLGHAGLTVAVVVLTWPGVARADVVERDHVRLSIDYLELRTAQTIEVTVKVDGKQHWKRQLPAQTLHVDIGTVAAPVGSAFSIVVESASGTVIGGAALTDTGTNASETVRQGELSRMIFSTRGVAVWAIPDIRVRVASALDDAARAALVKTLVGLNRAVVDRSDGQVRIDQFTIEPSASGTAPAGAFDLGPCGGACATEVGTPAKPAAARVAKANGDSLLRAFEHAYLGVPATRACWVGGSPPPAASGDDGGDGDDDDDFDCRIHLSSTLQKSPGLRLLPGGFAGPEPASPPMMRFADEQHLDFSQDASAAELDDEVINAVIARHGTALGRCMRSQRLRTATIKLSIRGEDGRVTWVRINGSREGNVHDCVARVADEMRFPRSKATKTVAVFEMSR